MIKILRKPWFVETRNPYFETGKIILGFQAVSEGGLEFHWFWFHGWWVNYIIYHFYYHNQTNTILFFIFYKFFWVLKPLAPSLKPSSEKSRFIENNPNSIVF